MAQLRDTQTHENLIAAFARESQDNLRYLYFAQKADVEGRADIAALFRAVAEGETGHALGHLDFLFEVGDPITGLTVGVTAENLVSAIKGELEKNTALYAGYARSARDEGFHEIAEWFETLARAEQNHARLFTHSLRNLGDSEPVDSQ
jgi:rubrerythrin